MPLTQNSTTPKVLIITTGGTIASRVDAPLVEGHELLQAIPELSRLADVTIHELVRIGSSKMTPEIWLQLASYINQRIEEQPDLACVLVTHGTDTMEETAFFLNLTHKHATPVVLVGSMRSSDHIAPDGPANLINALHTGLSKDAVGKGVLLVMNDQVSAGRDVSKMHNNRVDAFKPTDKGYIGSIENGKVLFHRQTHRPHTTNTPFNIYNLKNLPKVEIVQDFAGADKSILTHFLDRSNQGLVISAFAGGRMSKGFSSVYELKNLDKPVVITSSIKEGHIFGSNQTGSNIIMANSLSANKARILLQLCLTITDDPAKIQELFDTY